MTAAVSYERTREHLEALGLQAALEALDSVLEAGQKQERTTVEMLDDLLPGADRDLVRPLKKRLMNLFENIHLYFHIKRWFDQKQIFFH